MIFINFFLISFPFNFIFFLTYKSWSEGLLVIFKEDVIVIYWGRSEEDKKLVNQSHEKDST